MRLSIVLACMAGIALARSSKKHAKARVAKRSQDVEPCADDDTACWEAEFQATWEEAMDNTDFDFDWEEDDWEWEAEEADQPSGDCATNLDSYLYWGEDEECNQAWRDWDDWCNYGDEDEVDQNACSAAEDIMWGDQGDDWMVMKRKMKKTKKVEMFGKRSRFAKKRHAKRSQEEDCDEECQAEWAALEECDEACWEAIFNDIFDEAWDDDWTGGDDSWEDWTLDWEVEEAARPSGDCATNYDAFFYTSDNEDCNNAWSDWDKWCMFGDVSDTQACDCEDSNAAFWEAQTWDETWLHMRKKANTKRAMKKAGKKNVKMSKRRADDDEWTPDAPSAECMTVEAYEYNSDNEECNTQWLDWDYYCWSGEWLLEPTQACMDAEDWMLEIALVELAAPRPTEDCLTEEAYNYWSEDEECNAMWEAWDTYCWLEWTDECTAAEEDIWGEWDESDWDWENWEDEDWLEDYLSLAKSAQADQSSQYNNGLIVGGSVGAAAALAAIFAVSKYAKNNSIDDFQRA